MPQFVQVFVISFILMTSNLAMASFAIAELDPENATPAIGTHLVISGAGDEAGALWLKAAHTQAMVFRDRLPHGPIRLITAIDDAKRDQYLAILHDLGYQNISFRETTFDAAHLGLALEAQKLIASIDYIGHNGAFLGLGLESLRADHRFYLDDVDNLRGKLRFSKDAYIRLMGCNTGWYLAPYLARRLGVPTAGSLTSADVEILGADGNWYFDEAGLWPRALARAKTNFVSIGAARDCQGVAGCVRLKVINQSYTGLHGMYAGALPFLKFFCGGVNSNDCRRRMALSTRTLVGVSPMAGSPAGPLVPDFEQFAATLADQFCPSASLNKHQSCVAAVSRHLTGEKALPAEWTPLSQDAPKLSCSFKRCFFEVALDDNGSKVLVSTGPEASTVFVDELNAYRAGYELLRQAR